MVNEPALRDLYSWNAQLTRMAIMNWPRSVCEPMANDLPIDLDRATRAFFALIAARSGIAEHLEAHVSRPGLSDDERTEGAEELLAVIRRYSR